MDDLRAAFAAINAQIIRALSAFGSPWLQNDAAVWRSLRLPICLQVRWKMLMAHARWPAGQEALRPVLGDRWLRPTRLPRLRTVVASRSRSWRLASCRTASRVSPRARRRSAQQTYGGRSAVPRGCWAGFSRTRFTPPCGKAFLGVDEYFAPFAVAATSGPAISVLPAILPSRVSCMPTTFHRPAATSRPVGCRSFARYRAADGRCAHPHGRATGRPTSSSASSWWAAQRRRGPGKP